MTDKGEMSLYSGKGNFFVPPLRTSPPLPAVPTEKRYILNVKKYICTLYRMLYRLYNNCKGVIL